jgi:hypothetical protein
MKASDLCPVPYSRLFYTSLLAFVAALLLAGCSSNKTAVTAAMNQYNVASEELYGKLKELEKSPITASFGDGVSKAFQLYADRLRAVDINTCPQDFRVAFVRYYQEVDRLKAYYDSTTGWRGILKGFSNPGSIFRVPDNTDQAMKPFIEAGRNLVQVCTKYGLQFK